MENEEKMEIVKRLTQKIWEGSPYLTWSEAETDAGKTIASWEEA